MHDRLRAVFRSHVTVDIVELGGGVVSDRHSSSRWGRVVSNGRAVVTNTNVRHRVCGRDGGDHGRGSRWSALVMLQWEDGDAASRLLTLLLLDESSATCNMALGNLGFESVALSVPKGARG